MSTFPEMGCKETEIPVPGSDRDDFEGSPTGLGCVLETGMRLYVPAIPTQFNPSVPDAPNWHITVFEKRLHETVTS